ncbi:hypothetical protein RRG08_008926 [Elysia crispata]|uniref:Uncharacterized protein n=1 Tax=Elysia crispata TaxID=231223 RepID=A0AAE0ZWX4_9GAST|nr:hypothetical protein RRG08_008926 [Elysia crispata]
MFSSGNQQNDPYKEWVANGSASEQALRYSRRKLKQELNTVQRQVDSSIVEKPSHGQQLATLSKPERKDLRLAASWYRSKQFPGFPHGIDLNRVHGDKNSKTISCW